jgi:hypothetical protein
MNKFALFVSLIMLTIISVAYAQVYKWTDSQGLVHFSDTPHDGAEKIKIPDAQTFSPPTIPKVKLPDEDDQGKHTAKDHTYKKVAITQPLNEATIRNNDGYLVVTVELDPRLAEGDKVQLLFDGSPLGDPQTNLVFQLNGIYRGAHTITVEVLDSNGSVLNTSDPVTIFMQRPRVGMGKPG